MRKKVTPALMTTEKWVKSIPQGNRKMFQLFIGIDTGVNTGIAIWNKPDQKFEAIQTVFIHQAIAMVTEYVKDNPGSVLVRVEDARLRTWLPKNVGPEQLQGAGSIKRDATIWEHFLKSLAVDFDMVPPKNNKTKLKADYFKRLTGWSKTTSEHARDAAMLVFGK